MKEKKEKNPNMYYLNNTTEKHYEKNKTRENNKIKLSETTSAQHFNAKLQSYNGTFGTERAPVSHVQ